jgi:hypothetical protein
MEDIMALRISKAKVPGELGTGLVQQLGSMPEPVEVDYNNPAVARGQPGVRGQAVDAGGS